jgi:hypothetical protein
MASTSTRGIVNDTIGFSRVLFGACTYGMDLLYYSGRGAIQGCNSLSIATGNYELQHEEVGDAEV